METAGLKHFNDGDEWMTAEDIPNIDFFFCQTWLRAFVNGMSGSCGMNYSKILGVFKGTDMSFYYGKKNALDFALNLVRKLDADPAYGDEINPKNMAFFRRAEKPRQLYSRGFGGQVERRTLGHPRRAFENTLGTLLVG